MKNRKAHARPHGRFVLEQVPEVDALERIINPLLKHHPHRPDAAVRRISAAVLGNRMREAPNVECGVLRGRYHLSHRNVSGVTREHISAMRAPYTGDDAGSAHSKQDLLDIIRRKALLQSDLAAGYRPVTVLTGKVQGADEAILSPGRDPHRSKS